MGMRAGEQQALAQAYDLYSQAVYTVALRVSGNEALAEDVLHEVFLNLWRCPSSLGGFKGHLVGALVREARHLSLMTRPSPSDFPE
jgi:DNA-directed RNA polymerase specialized sigma24 family protein